MLLLVAPDAWRERLRTAEPARAADATTPVGDTVLQSKKVLVSHGVTGNTASSVNRISSKKKKSKLIPLQPIDIELYRKSLAATPPTNPSIESHIDRSLLPLDQHVVIDFSLYRPTFPKRKEIEKGVYPGVTSVKASSSDSPFSLPRSIDEECSVLDGDGPSLHSVREGLAADESVIFERLVSDGNSDGAVANPSMPLESSEDIAQFDEGINNMGEVVRSDEWAVQLVAREHASQTSPSPPTTLVSCSIPEDPTPVPCDTAHSRHSAIPEHMNDSGAHKENLRVRGEGEAILPPIGTVLRVPEVQSRPDVPTIYSVTSTSLPALPPPSSSGSANQRRESKPTKPDVSDLEVVKQLRQALRGRAEVQ